MNTKTTLLASITLLMVLFVAGCGQELMTTPNLHGRADADPFENVPLHYEAIA